MTTLREDVYAALTAGSPARRAYPERLPVNVVLPGIVYSFIFDQPEENLAGEDCGLVNAHLQVDVYSNTQAEADAVAEEIRLSMLAAMPFCSRTIGGLDAFESDTRLYRVMKEYSLWRTS